ncbi:MAG: hypothetical protein MdMp014T_1696 [Treponematales bacterium]
MVRTKDLERGKSYRKEDFGIVVPAAMQANHLIDGEVYIFFSMSTDKNNREEADGFVFEAPENRLVGKGCRVAGVRHIFLKKTEDSAEYTYLGRSVCEERFRHPGETALCGDDAVSGTSSAGEWSRA